MATRKQLDFGSKLRNSSGPCKMECWNVRTIIWTTLLALLVFWPNTVQGQCKKINDCRCKLPNGKLIDLSKIGNNGGSTPRFDYATPEDQQFAVWEFSFNGCYSYSDEYCTGAVLAEGDVSNLWEYSFNGCYSYSDEYCSGNVACQRSTDHTITPGYALGTPDTADYTDGTLLKFGAIDQNGQQRYTEVALVCDKGGTPESSSLRRLGEPNFDWVYKYELTSKCACPNGCAKGGDGGLSIGSILCILFTVLVVCYLVGGVIFMKFVRGAEGKELIPNVNIWMQFPSLVKDGALYVVSFVKPGVGKSGYETSI